MRKLLLLLLLFAASARALEAAWTAREIPAPTDRYQFTHLTADGDGFLAIRCYLREERLLAADGGYEIRKHFTYALQRLGADLQVTWERRMPERSDHDVPVLLVANDAVYWGGEMPGEDFRCLLRRFDRQGQLQWEKTYAIDGCKGSRSLTLYPMPDGDILGLVLGMDCNASNNGLHFLRIAPDGMLRWQGTYNLGRYKYFSGSKPVALANGDIIFSNMVQKPVPGGTHDQLNVVWIDGATGKAKLDQMHDFGAHDLDIRGGALLPSGDVAFTGHFSFIEPGSAYPQVYNAWVVVGPDGQLKGKHHWRSHQNEKLDGLVRLADGRLFVTGSSMDFDATMHQTGSWICLYEFGTDMSLLGSYRFPMRADVLWPLVQSPRGGLIARQWDRYVCFDPA